MRRVWPKTEGIVIRSRTFVQSDLVMIRKLIRDHPYWGRTRLSEEVCRLFDWRQDNGRLKDRGCRVALLKLEALGYLKLPRRKLETGGQPPRVDLKIEIPNVKITAMPEAVTLTFVKTAAQSRRWNALIANFHYLGLATPVGRLIRYLIYGDNEILGAISFSEAAWSINIRDELLANFGLSQDQIRPAVISNNRFLILPHVQVRNLASKVLGAATKKVIADWSDRFETTPQFIETFVDPTRFKGICYQAANWKLIGSTKGFSKQGANHKNKNAPKLLFMAGTSYHAQEYLRNQCIEVQKRAA